MVSPVTGLKIVHMLDSPAFPTLLLLLPCGGTCESAVIAVARRRSVAVQYNGSAIFVKSCGLLCCALEGLQRLSTVAAVVFLQDQDKDTFLHFNAVSLN